MQQLLLLSSDEGWGQALNGVLEPHHVAFERTDSCAIALEKIRDHFHGVVVADADFAKCNSFIFTRLVKFNSHHKQIPIVVISSALTDESLAQEVHADLFLSKPVPPAVLWEQLQPWR
jgi:DNA-binding response OmpR family regulator